MVGWVDNQKQNLILNEEKMKVAFICVHNSCCFQMAEVLGKYLGKDVFEDLLLERGGGLRCPLHE